MFVNTSIVYTRSRAAFFIFFVAFLFLELLGFGMLLDYFPDMDAGPALLFFIAIFFTSFLLAQITSKASLRLVVYQEYIQLIPVRDNHFVAKPDLVLWFVEIKQVEMRNSFVNGSYILLSLHNGKRVRLCRKLHIFSKEHTFYETYTALLKAIHGGGEAVQTTPMPAKFAPAPTPVAEATAIELKRSPRIYLVQMLLFFVCIFCMGLLPLAFFIGSGGTDFKAIAISILGFFIGVYSIMNFLAAVPDVKIYVSGITVYSARYQWRDVASVVLNGKVPYKYLTFRFMMTGVSLRFRDGSVICLHDSTYSNLESLRTFLKKVVLDDARYADIILEGDHQLPKVYKQATQHNKDTTGYNKDYR